MKSITCEFVKAVRTLHKQIFPCIYIRDTSRNEGPITTVGQTSKEVVNNDGTSLLSSTCYLETAQQLVARLLQDDNNLFQTIRKLGVRTTFTCVKLSSYEKRNHWNKKF